MKPPPGRVRFLTEEERSKLLAVCSTRLQQALELALDTGLRRGELFGLQRPNLDFKNRMIRVEHSKIGERRDVPMSDRVYGIMQAIPPRLDTTAVLDPWHTYAAEWKRAVAASGVLDFTWHDARHTFASNLVMAGVDIRTVQTLLGHKTITMTMRYAHLSPAHLKDAISKLPGNELRTKQEQAATRGQKPTA